MKNIRLKFKVSCLHTLFSLDKGQGRESGLMIPPKFGWYNSVLFTHIIARENSIRPSSPHCMKGKLHRHRQDPKRSSSVEPDDSTNCFALTRDLGGLVILYRQGGGESLDL